MGNAFAYISLMLAVSGGPKAQVPQTHQDVIKLDNVCIKVRYGYEYNISSDSDYLRVDVRHNGIQGHIYVGHNPQLKEGNRKWESMTLRDMMKSPKVISLEGAQAGQVLGIPVREEDRFFHLWFDSGNNEPTLTIREIVGFCK